MVTITKKTAILIVIFFSLILLYIYIKSEKENSAEMLRIRDLERKKQLAIKRRDLARDRTVECPIPGLENPRDCYLKSNRECKWDDDAKRCNFVEQ